MDLTRANPRSPNEMLAGIVSLPRMIDKTRAFAEGTLGEYIVDCPHDRPVLQLLCLNFPTFAAKLRELDYDDTAIEAWARDRLAPHGSAELAAFNRARRAWAPEVIAPGGRGPTTWFKLLDLEEKRNSRAVAGSTAGGLLRQGADAGGKVSRYFRYGGRDRLGHAG